MKRVLLLAMLLLCQGCREKTPAPVPSLRLDAASAPITVGDPARISFLLRTQEAVDAPDWAALLRAPVELLSEDRRPPVLENGIWEQRGVLKVTSFVVTNTSIFAASELPLHPYTNLTVALPDLALQVVSVLSASNEVPMIGTPALPDFRSSEARKRFWRNLGISLVLLLALLAGILVATRERLAKLLSPAPPPLPAWDQVALRELDHLAQSEDWTLPRVDPAVMRLSDILRHYIGNRFGLHAPERTTEEFLQELEAQRPWEDSVQRSVIEFLTGADRIKFAGADASRETLDAMWKRVHEFVVATAAPPPVEGEPCA